MEYNSLVASRIKEIRNQYGFTSESVANMIGIAKSNYSQLENGKVDITINRLNQLSEIFKVPMQTFLPTGSSQTIQITNGDHSQINGTQINNQIDPLILESLNQAINILQGLMNR